MQINASSLVNYVSYIMKTLIHLTGVLLILVTACGGGGGGGGSTAASGTTVTGVAAVGAPIDGVVSLKDSLGNTKQTSTNATTGAFTLDTTSLTPPFILRAQKSNGDFLYSTSVTNGISNINPLSNVIMGAMSNTAGTGTDPNSLYQAFTTYSNKITAAALDTATASMYGKLSTSFKAKMGSTDTNPIYAPFSIGNALDKAFDSYSIVYDTQSGYMQEKDTSTIKFETFGTLGTLSGITAIGGTYTGEVQIGNNNRAIFANIASDGEVAIYVDSEYLYFGKIAKNGTVASGSGVMYKLGSNGVSAYEAQKAISSTLTAMISGSSLNLTFSASVITSPQAMTIKPYVNGTYGNSLFGSAKAFKSTTLGPFSTSDGTGTQSGTKTSYTSKIFLTEETGSNCTMTAVWTLKLADLEQSVYYITLKETAANSYTYTSPSLLSSNCTHNGKVYETVGGGVFTSTGLLTLLVDKTTKDNVNHEYAFVAAKLFTK